MGFCDVAPGAERQLRIVYLWRHKPFQAVLGEEVRGAEKAARVRFCWCVQSVAECHLPDAMQEGATLPSAGVEITDDELVSATHASVQEQGIPTSCPAEAVQS